MPTSQPSGDPDWASQAPKDLLNDRPYVSEPTVSYSGLTGQDAPTGEPDQLLAPKRVRKPKRSISVPRGGTLTLEQYRAQEARIVSDPPAVAGTPPPSGRKVWYGGALPTVDDDELRLYERPRVATVEELDGTENAPILNGSAEIDDASACLGEPYDEYDYAAFDADDEDFDDRALWERQIDLPADWYEKSQRKAIALANLMSRFVDRFGRPPTKQFADDDELGLYLELRLSAPESDSDLESMAVPVCSNCHELPVSAKRRELCAPCDRYRRDHQGQSRPSRLFNSHRRTPVGERRTGT